MTINPSPIKDPISLKDLEKIDIRVGTIEKVEDIEKSDKLVRLIVDFGFDKKKKVIVGMKQERKDPRQIEGMQALFVLNLEPHEIMGEVSEAMLFDIGFADKITPVMALPEKPVPNGVRVI